jgi:glycerophosphoryl diester phosphodiesterase
MKSKNRILAVSALALGASAFATAATADWRSWGNWHGHRPDHKVEFGPRPLYLVERMDDGPLKQKLESCREMDGRTSDFSIAHRGAPLQFPEHTRESYEAGIRMGAGIQECDVTFTKDRELVCRHAQCDLEQTTDILARPEMAARCTVPPDFSSAKPYEKVSCCTHDFTLAEFKSLCGKMDGINRNGTTAAAAMNGTTDWRTNLYNTCAELMTHAESIELFDSYNLKMTPELKTPPAGLMPFEGDFTQEDYAQKLVDEYKAAGIHGHRVFAQSFLLDDVIYWVNAEPAFGHQAVFLDGRYESPGFSPSDPSTWVPSMEQLEDMGVNIIAPPIYVLVQDGENGKIVPSPYARRAKRAGLDIIAWTFERSDLRLGAKPNPAAAATFYYQSVPAGVTKDADMYKVLDVLAKRVEILGIFSDWPASVTYYANCMGL